MNMPPMTSSNSWARVNERLEFLERVFNQLGAASGTLDSATIYKRGLTILSESNNGKAFLGDGSIAMWDDYVANPNGFGRIYTDPVEGQNYMRWFPPYSSGNGQQNSVTMRGASPDLPGAFWVYTDGAALIDADQAVHLNAGTSAHVHAGTSAYLTADDAVQVTAGGQFFVDADSMSLLTNGDLRIYELPTTGSAANIRLDPATAAIGYVTSSLRYKQDVEDLDIDVDAFLKLRPRSWRDKGEVERDPDTARRNVGFIAEEVDELGLPFVDYDGEDRPDALQYDRFTAGAVKVMQRQQSQIATQAAEIAELKAANAAILDRLEALETA